MHVQTALKTAYRRAVPRPVPAARIQVPSVRPPLSVRLAPQERTCRAFGISCRNRAPGSAAGRQVFECRADAGGDGLRRFRRGIVHADDAEDHGLVVEVVEGREIEICSTVEAVSSGRNVYLLGLSRAT